MGSRAHETLRTQRPPGVAGTAQHGGEEGEEALSLKVGGGSQPGDLGKCRVNINQLGDLGGCLAVCGGYPGDAEDAGHPGGLLKEVLFLELVVLPEQVSVITGKNNDGIFP